MKVKETASLLVVIALSLAPVWGQGSFRQRLMERFGAQAADSTSEMYKIAGLDVAVWKPQVQQEGKAPLVVFSHGFHGCNTQSKFIMQALAKAGYLVVAPNHKDAIGGGGGTKPELPFQKFNQWTDQNYLDRRKDIVTLIDALHNDPNWNAQIDWSKVALAGHSLGGYTVLALGGAWPSWKLPGIKAILALSPYAQPFVLKGNLSGMHIPVMYQSGTRDFGIGPFIKREGGAFIKTESPAYFVEFEKAGHLAWTNFDRDKAQQDLIDYYCVAFLHKYVNDISNAKPERKLAGVATLEMK